MNIKKLRQNGAVSLFVVIFAALLMTVVTVGFIQIMVKDQQQATTTDLSASANDSAEAGIEDAKRLLLLDQACRDGTAGSTVNCLAIESALTPAPGKNETECDTLSKAGIVGENNNETLIQQTTGDGADKLDQAYTCVKVAVNTEDYPGQLPVNGSTLVPLVGATDFDSVEVSWFTRADVPSSTTNPAVNFPSIGSDVSLPRVGTKWPVNTPPLMRTQLIQTGTSFKLSDLDDSQPGNKSDANTLFLYPSATALATKDFALDARRSPTNTPQQVQCSPSLNDAEYVCKTTITLPSPIDGNIANRNAFLRLTSLYNGAHFKIKLKKAGSDVFFNRVQPRVDSTGRANDVFRRIQARVELKGNVVSPETDISGNLCKDFTVTDTEAGYVPSSSCAP